MSSQLQPWLTAWPTATQRCWSSFPKCLCRSDTSSRQWEVYANTRRQSFSWLWREQDTDNTVCLPTPSKIPWLKDSHGRCVQMGEGEPKSALRENTWEKKNKNGKSRSGVRKGKDILEHTCSVVLRGRVIGKISQWPWQSFPWYISPRKRVNWG